MFDFLDFFLNPTMWAITFLLSCILVLFEWRINVASETKPFLDLTSLRPALASSTHQLTHRGGVSNYFLNLDYLTTDPDDIARLTNWYVDAIKRFCLTQDVDSLVFIEKDSGPIGAISLMGNIVSQTHIPGIIARLKKRNLHARMAGKPELIEKLSDGLNVLIVTDVITTMRTVQDTVDTVKDFGGRVVGVCTILDRRDEEQERHDEIPVLKGTTQDELQRLGFVKSLSDVDT